MPNCGGCSYYCSKERDNDRGFCVVVNPGFKTNVKKEQVCRKFEKNRNKGIKKENRFYLEEWRLLL